MQDKLICWCSPIDTYIWTHLCWSTYKNIYQICVDTGCHLQDSPIATANRDGRQGSIKGIHAASLPWWWIITVIYFILHFSNLILCCWAKCFVLSSQIGSWDVDFQTLHTLSACLTIHCRRVGSSPKKRCPGYDTKLHLIIRFQFWSSGKCEVPHHCCYS